MQFVRWRNGQRRGKLAQLHELQLSVLQQLHEHKHSTKGELFRIVFQTRELNLVNAIHKIHGEEGQRSVELDNAAEVSRLIDSLDRNADIPQED